MSCPAIPMTTIHHLFDRIPKAIKKGSNASHNSLPTYPSTLPIWLTCVAKSARTTYSDSPARSSAKFEAMCDKLMLIRPKTMHPDQAIANIHQKVGRDMATTGKAKDRA